MTAATESSPPVVPAQSQSRALAAFILVALIWGSTWLVIKDQVSAVPPGWAAVKTGRHVRPASGEVAVDVTGPVGQVDQVVAQTNSALAVPWTV